MTLVSPEEISRVIAYIQGGDLVVYPTESSYGIGCMAGNAAAVARVFALKERLIEKTLPLIIGSMDEAKRLIEWSPIAEKLAQKHWPGPLTIVAPATEEGKRLALGVMAADGTIALRVSSHPVALALAKAVGPIVSTSANRGNEPPCFNAACIMAWLGDADVMAIDAGTLPRNLPSTIVRVKKDGYEVVRNGTIVKI